MRDAGCGTASCRLGFHGGYQIFDEISRLASLDAGPGGDLCVEVAWERSLESFVFVRLSSAWCSVGRVCLSLDVLGCHKVIRLPGGGGGRMICSVFCSVCSCSCSHRNTYSE